MPAPHHSEYFYRPDAFPAAQPTVQSTEANETLNIFDRNGQTGESSLAFFEKVRFNNFSLELKL